MYMSWVIAAPEYVAAAANDLAGIGSTLSQANMAALAPISGVLPAGADEVSFAISALFDAHAQAYQALSAQAALFHQQFVQLMSGGAGQYAAAEAANVLPMQVAAAAINDPVQALTGRPLIGNGANGARAPGKTAGRRVATGQRRQRRLRRGRPKRRQRRIGRAVGQRR
ncbi:PE family protein [Mycobacterium kansasii]|uniref:PE family protein n=1 Tax=Mycobacterium kansasii TaxID=1768 RepID=A0A1V3XLQ1_MYCKA|nr:PE family protein [Mycobacterium kansasii]